MFRIFKIDLRFVVHIFFIFNYLTTFSQTYTLKGILWDKAEHSPIPGAGVLIHSKQDSSMKVGLLSDEYGRFQSRLPPGQYILKVSSLGYPSFSTTFSIWDREKELDTILLSSVALETKTVLVQGRQERVVQKGDTTEYNAAAFKVNPDATVQDLVTKMPGITQENGTVKAQGEVVQKVTVDGKEFFGDDASMALKNLPAEIVDKIQVFNRLSDQSQFTGIDDGNSYKSINIVTKAGRNNGKFGKFLGGYGTNARYQLAGNLNIFKGNRRISLLGLDNNINQQNFTSQDLLGVSSGAGNQGGGGRGGRGGGGGQNNNNPSANFLTGQQSGITTTQSFGLNYSDSWGKKLNLTGSYFFNKAENANATVLNREYFLAGKNTQLFDQNGGTNSTNFNHRFNVRLEYKVDSANTFLLTPKLSFQNNQTTTQQTGLTQLQTGEKLNQTNNVNGSNNQGYTFANNLQFRHKFAKARRTFSVDLGLAINNKSGSNSLKALNEFVTSRGDSLSALDQQSNTSANGTTYTSTLLYSEPISKRSVIQLSYSPSYTKNTSSKLTDTLNPVDRSYSLLDTALSSRYNNTVMTQKGGVRYVFKETKWDFQIGLEGQNVQLQGSQDFPKPFETNKSFLNALPNAMLYYKFSKTSNLRFMYRTQTDVPSISQLQHVVNNTNPLQLSTGNPLLKQQYTHLFTLRYRTSTAEKARSFNVFFSNQYVQNYQGTKTVIAQGNTVSEEGVTLHPGTQLTLPVNLQGYWNTLAFLNHSRPLDFLKSNLSLTLGSTFSRTPSQINAAVNFANVYTETAGVGLGSNISEKVDFSISTTGNYTVIKNSIRPELDNNYYYQLSTLKATVLIRKSVVLNSEWNHTYYTGLGAGYDINFVLWNAGIGYKFLKNKSGELRLTVFDLLNQNKSVNRTVTGNYVETSKTQVLTRYFMLTFSYTLRNFAATAQNRPPFPKPDNEGRPRPSPPNPEN